MKKNKDNSKPTWRIWLIKKLLTNQINKDDILKILSENTDLNTKNDYDDLDNNNGSKLLNAPCDLIPILHFPSASVLSGTQLYKVFTNYYSIT